MKTPHPVPLNNDGSFSDIITELCNKLELATGFPVDVSLDETGNIDIVYYMPPAKPIKNKNKRPTIHEQHLDNDVIYRDEDFDLFGIQETLAAMKKDEPMSDKSEPEAL
jgi:hypothetical protein